MSKVFIINRLTKSYIFERKKGVNRVNEYEVSDLHRKTSES